MSLKHYSQKQKLTILKKAEKIGVREAAKISGIHFTTIYAWRNALQDLDEQVFLNHTPSRPGRGVKEITPEQEHAILSVWDENRGYGPGQVRGQLRRQGITIGIRTIRKVLIAKGYEPSSKKPDKGEDSRFEASRPLELAQMDILEFFINKLKMYLILLLDDFSRFILGWRLLEETSIDEVIGVVTEAMDRYGKMGEILTDRGFVFYSWRGINRFEKYLEDQGIDQIHARPHHPQTLGKVEACNKRIKTELVVQKHFATAHEARAAIGQWVEHYNYRRPHQGIGGYLVPAERFHGLEKQALRSMEKGVDIAGANGNLSFEVERSVINLVVEPSGQLVLYLMGHPIVRAGGTNGKIEFGRSGGFDSCASAVPGEGLVT